MAANDVCLLVLDLGYDVSRQFSNYKCEIVAFKKYYDSNFKKYYERM